MLGMVLGTIWSVLAFPFHLLFWLVEWFGRLTALILGFLLMVLGVALWAGALGLVGIPLFVVGLLVTQRAINR